MSPKPHIRKCAIIWILLTLTSFHCVRADEVILINGDKLSGNLIKQEDGTLSFKTEYVGEVSIKWKHVRELRTDEPMQIKLYE